MPEALEDIEDTLDICEVTPALLHQLVRRIEASTQWPHLIYREAEIDQVWRLVEHPSAETDLPPPMLDALREKIMLVHDLVGIEHKPMEAAAMLRSTLGDTPA